MRILEGSFVLSYCFLFSFFYVTTHIISPLGIAFPLGNIPSQWQLISQDYFLTNDKIFNQRVHLLHCKFSGILYLINFADFLKLYLCTYAGLATFYLSQHRISLIFLTVCLQKVYIFNVLSFSFSFFMFSEIRHSLLFTIHFHCLSSPIPTQFPLNLHPIFPHPSAFDMCRKCVYHFSVYPYLREICFRHPLSQGHLFTHFP